MPKEHMPQKKTQDKKNKLFDVEVDTVGLVSEGANREKFFLLKSEEDNSEKDNSEKDEIKEVNSEKEDKSKKEDIMPDEKDIEPGADKGNETDTETQTSVTEETVRNTVLSTLQQAFGFLGKSADESDPPDDSDPAEREAEAQEQLDKIAELEKGQNLLKEELEKAREDARLEREQRERQEYVGKIEIYKSTLPIEIEELADDLMAIRKADSEVADRIEKLLSAVHEQLKEAGLFDEVGTTETPEGEPNNLLEKVESLKKEKEISDADALLQLSKEEAQEYLRQQRQSKNK